MVNKFVIFNLLVRQVLVSARKYPNAGKLQARMRVSALDGLLIFVLVISCIAITLLL